jgi:ATP-binding cassette subfamily F protein uup
VLVMDEPTNDLDLETLELLEAELVEWPGTLLLVSHDRAFLDNVVTSTIVFDSDGQLHEYVGGYEDWVRQRAAAMAPASAPPSKAPSDKPAGTGKTIATARAKAPAAGAAAKPAGKKLSYREQREFDELPARIEALEAEQRDLAAAVADPLFYKKGADAIAASLARQEKIAAELAVMYARWDALDARATRSTPAPSSTSRSR